MLLLLLPLRCRRSAACRGRGGVPPAAGIGACVSAHACASPIFESLFHRRRQHTYPPFTTFQIKIDISFLINLVSLQLSSPRAHANFADPFPRLLLLQRGSSSQKLAALFPLTQSLLHFPRLLL